MPAFIFWVQFKSESETSIPRYHPTSDFTQHYLLKKSSKEKNYPTPNPTNKQKRKEATEASYRKSTIRTHPHTSHATSAQRVGMPARC
jgi:hypothetical protein